MLLGLSMMVFFNTACGPWAKYNTKKFGKAKQLHFSTYILKFDVAAKNRKVKTKDDVYYTWFAGDRIKETQGGYSENLLHGVYQELYSNKNLKAKGEFCLGRKTGTWRKWAENGDLLEVSNWKKGRKTGRFVTYENGVVVKDLTFKKNVEQEPKEKKDKEESKKKDTSKDLDPESNKPEEVATKPSNSKIPTK